MILTLQKDIKNEIETDSFIKFENLCINIIKWNEMTKGKELYIIRDPPLLIVRDNYNNSEITVALTEDIIEDNSKNQLKGIFKNIEENLDKHNWNSWYDFDCLM
jgi:hypothetical protein